jgi:hypothetical protein
MVNGVEKLVEFCDADLWVQIARALSTVIALYIRVLFFVTEVDTVHGSPLA